MLANVETIEIYSSQDSQNLERLLTNSGVASTKETGCCKTTGLKHCLNIAKYKKLKIKQKT